jgi:hypothetical protein
MEFRIIILQLICSVKIISTNFKKFLSGLRAGIKRKIHEPTDGKTRPSITCSMLFTHLVQRTRKIKTLFS